MSYGGVLADYAWVYDSANRITQFTNPDGVIDYTYDEIRQLTAAESDYQADESYSYDGNGNRTNPGYSTGSNNRLLSDGVYNYQYDGEGNRTVRTEIATGEVTEYSWDYRNRLIGVVTLDRSGNILSEFGYTYDVFNRRLSKSAQGSVLEVFVYDGEHIALVFDGDGRKLNRYLHGPNVDQIIADEDGSGSVLWALVDNLGTVRYVVGNDGEVLNRISYDSFGEVISETNPSIESRFLFTGRESDPETGLVYYRGRYKDGERFISEDPIGFAGGDGNLYRYTFNSPTNFTDPSGHCVPGLLPTAGGIALVDGPVVPVGDIIAGGLVIGGCLGVVIQRLVDDRPTAPEIPSNGPRTKPKDTPVLAPPPVRPNRSPLPRPTPSRDEDPTLLRDPNDCNKKLCKDDPELSKFTECKDIKDKSLIGTYTGYIYNELGEAAGELRKVRGRERRLTDKREAKDWWRATVMVDKGEVSQRSPCDHPTSQRGQNGQNEQGALHYNVLLDDSPWKNGQRNWGWQSSSVGSLGRCECCEDTNGKPRKLVKYAVLNIKKWNGDRIRY